MYLMFYGLKEKPFNLTPDPKFLYLTPGHQEALAQLLYGVQERKGFIVLTGEVGTGKTTLLHALMEQLNGNTEVAFIFNSKLPFDGLLEYIIEDFGIAKTTGSQAQRLFALNAFLIERQQAGQNTVLIIDEAQHLDPSTLEQVRLLSNFETTTEKLLQILLVGQPELKARLELPELRQLKHRIGLRCGIPPLTPKEGADYIRHRLRIAGAHDIGLFSDGAVSRIVRYAGGNPRIVNIICDHCLLIGYADQQRKIGRDTAEQAIEYMEEGKRPWYGNRSITKWRVIASFPGIPLAIGLGLLGSMAFLILHSEDWAHFMDLLAGLFRGLALFVRDLLGQIGLVFRGMLS
jgi:general secretion pathway protein A